MKILLCEHSKAKLGTPDADKSLLAYFEEQIAKPNPRCDEPGCDCELECISFMTEDDCRCSKESGFQPIPTEWLDKHGLRVRYEMSHPVYTKAS